MEIAESLAKVLESRENFGSVFYEEFFSRFPEVVPHFEGVDMERQSLVLTMALSIIERYNDSTFGAIDHYLQHLGSAHHRRAIPAELYPKWIEAMLAALERFLGDDWNSELESEWRTALEKTSRTMLKGYERRVGI